MGEFNGGEVEGVVDHVRVGQGGEGGLVEELGDVLLGGEGEGQLLLVVAGGEGPGKVARYGADVEEGFIGGVFEDAFLLVVLDLDVLVLYGEGGYDSGIDDHGVFRFAVDEDRVVAGLDIFLGDGAGEGEGSYGFALDRRPCVGGVGTDGREGVPGVELPDVDEVPAGVGKLVGYLFLGDAGAEIVAAGFSGVEEAAGGGAFVSGAPDAAVFETASGGAEGETVGEFGEIGFARYAADIGIAFDGDCAYAVRDDGIKGLADHAAYCREAIGKTLDRAAGKGAADSDAREKADLVGAFNLAHDAAVGELGVVGVADKETDSFVALHNAENVNVLDYGVAGAAEEALGGFFFGFDEEIFDREVIAVEGAGEGGGFGSYGREAQSAAPVFGFVEIDVGGESVEKVFGVFGLLFHPD